eukprot:scaffold27831_cov75-Phaeocystis_antarctica.AAC.1
MLHASCRPWALGTDRSHRKRTPYRPGGALCGLRARWAAASDPGARRPVGAGGAAIAGSSSDEMRSSIVMTGIAKEPAAPRSDRTRCRERADRFVRAGS